MPIRKHRKQIRKKRVVKRKSANPFHIPRVFGIVMPERIMKKFRYNTQLSLNGTSNLNSFISMTLDGANRISTGAGSYSAGVLANGLYHWLGSNILAASTSLGLNTGMYSGMRNWRSEIKLTFVPLKIQAATNDSYVFYAYPYSDPVNGAITVAPTFAGILEQPSVKYVYVNTQNTANPKTLRFDISPPKLMGLAREAYTASQYDITVATGTISYPSLSIGTCYLNFGVLSNLATGAADTVTGTIFVEHVMTLELFDRNGISTILIS